jgi:hypothetical protein
MSALMPGSGLQAARGLGADDTAFAIGVPSAVDNLLAYARLLTETSLLGIIFLTLVAFEILNIFWMAVIFNFFPTLMDDASSLGAFSNVNLLIGFLYFLWIGTAMNGHTSTMRLYRRTVNAATSLACVAVGTPGAEGLRIVCAEFPHFVYSIFVAAYTPEQILYHSNDPELNEALKIASTSIERTQAAYLVIARRVANLTPEIAMVTKVHLDHMASIVADLDVSGNILPPTLLDTHLFVFLFFYFAIFVPISLFVQFGAVINLVVYPFLMLLLVAPKLYTAFLGDAFDPRTPQKVADHHIWHIWAARMINAHFGLRGGTK